MEMTRLEQIKKHMECDDETDVDKVWLVEKLEEAHRRLWWLDQFGCIPTTGVVTKDATRAFLMAIRPHDENKDE